MVRVYESVAKSWVGFCTVLLWPVSAAPAPAALAEGASEAAAAVAALDLDDQCAAGASECAWNALQLRGVALAAGTSDEEVASSGHSAWSVFRFGTKEKCCRCKSGAVGWSASGKCSFCVGAAAKKKSVSSDCRVRDRNFQGNTACAKLCGSSLKALQEDATVRVASAPAPPALAGRTRRRSRAALLRVMRRRGGRPMLWLHIHKAGGTTMCRMAQEAGERVVRPGGNCNWRPYDMYSRAGRKKGSDVSCERRTAYFRLHRFTYGQIERDLQETDLCWDAFSYGALLREPIDLMTSQLNFGAKYYKGPTKAELLASLRQALSLGRFSRPGERELYNFDNLQTRLLAGAYRAPPGSLSRAHLELARARLANFTVLCRMEDLARNVSRGALLRKMGWPDSSLHANAMHGAEFSFTEAEAAWLREVNSLDVELYSSIPAC